MAASDNNINSPYSPQFLAAAKVMFEPLMSIIVAAIRAIEKIDQSDDVLISPRTNRHNMQRDIGAAADNVKIPSDPDDYFNAVIIVFCELFILRLPETIQDMQKVLESKSADFLAKFSGHPAYNSLLTLEKSAGTKSANECNEAFKILNIEKTDYNLQIVYGTLHRARAADCEQRAEYAIQAAKKTSEMLYQPYVRVLHWLFRISNNNKNNANLGKMKYGAIYKELLESSFPTDYPGLLQPNAVLIRNAEAHENWDYLPDSNEVELSDDAVAPMRFSVDELLARTEEMLLLSGVMLPGYIPLRGIKNLEKIANFAEGIKSILPDLINSDLEKRNAAFQVLLERVKDMNG